MFLRVPCVSVLSGASALAPRSLASAVNLFALVVRTTPLVLLTRRVLPAQALLQSYSCTVGSSVLLCRAQCVFVQPRGAGRALITIASPRSVLEIEASRLPINGDHRPSILRVERYRVPSRWSPDVGRRRRTRLDSEVPRGLAPFHSNFTDRLSWVGDGHVGRWNALSGLTPRSREAPF